MAATASILASSITTGLAIKNYDQAEQHRRRTEAQRQNTLQRQKETIIAANRARQYASGIGGKSAQNLRDDVRTRYDHAIGNVAGTGDNGYGKINLLAQSLRDWSRS